MAFLCNHTTNLSKPTSFFHPISPKLSPILKPRSIFLASKPTVTSKTAVKMATFSPLNKNYTSPLLNFYRNRFSKKPISPLTKIRALSSDSASVSTTKNNTKSIIIWSTVTALLAVSNRVFYKLALVPLKDYPFFLAQFITFGYVAIYFAILFIRHRAGIVTDEMLAIPKSRFVFIGFLEAIGLAAGMTSAAMIPGPAIPILNQTFLVWQLLLSYIVLGKRYSLLQIVGCLLVAAGVVVAVSSGSDGGQVLSGIELVWPALMISSGAFHAGASILKESVFRDSAVRLKDKTLDIFVVNSFGSACQALFVLLLLPVLSNLKGIPFPELPMYLKAGAACFVKGCDGAPLLPLLYVGSNISFNIAVLNLLKIAGAVVASLVTMISVQFLSISFHCHCRIFQKAQIWVCSSSLEVRFLCLASSSTTCLRLPRKNLDFTQQPLCTDEPKIHLGSQHVLPLGLLLVFLCGFVPFGLISLTYICIHE